MRDWTIWVSWLRRDDKRIKVFIHNKCDEKELEQMFWGSTLLKADTYNDDDAHILMCGNHTVIYRVRNEVYIVPATVKAVVNNNDGKLSFWFEYPCEMDRKDLVEY